MEAAAIIGIFVSLLILSSFIVGGIFLIFFLKKSSHRMWLLKELTLWKNKQIIDSESFDKIQEMYTPKQKESIPPIKIIISIGSILLGIGLILFIASNWQFLSGQFKLLLRVCLTIYSTPILH